LARKTRASDGVRRGEPLRFVRGHNSRGDNNPAWNGGRRLSLGYVLVHQPGHPRSSTDGYVAEHILIVEAVIGHALPSKARIHHVDEQKSNNAHGNLVACEDQNYHMRLHRRNRALLACGDAGGLICMFCHQYDTRDALRTFPRNDASGVRAFHPECSRESWQVVHSQKLLLSMTPTEAHK
jgi:hypothetical protein